MKISKRIRRGAISILLVLSILASATVSIFAQSDTEDSSESANSGDTVDVVMLVNDVAAGRKIKSSDIEVRTLKNVNIPANIISDKKEVMGKYAKAQLYAGEYVYKEQLSEKSVASSNSQLLTQAISRSENKFVNVTDYVPADTGEDLTVILQKIIDTNTKRTIYFPDGEYIISRPLTTCGAAGSTVSLWLSDGAVIKADPENWRSEGNFNAMICLGGQDAFQDYTNDVETIGSYYSLQGGTLDCSGVAEGISIDGGRETLVKNILIKGVSSRGIHIKKGANSAPESDSGSSDQEMHHVTIVCDGTIGSVGLHIDKGFDNHFSNFRIYDAQIGIKIETGGNSMKNMRVYYTQPEKLNGADKKYDETLGIWDISGDNFFYQCTVENCTTAFSLIPRTSAFDACTARWTSDACKKQTAYAFNGTFYTCASAMRAEFFGSSPSTAFSIGAGQGAIESPIVNDSLCDNKTYQNLRRYTTVPLY